ncbi:MAG: GtrA family protein, partial [Ruminococcus sp.]|nr:GtrA family protein [Ruminococcus sp.]
MKKLIRKIVTVFPKPIRDLYFNYEDKWLYLFFGGLTTFVSFASAGFAKWVLERWGGFDDGAVSDISTVFSWVCAVTFAYLTNRVWVFDSTTKGAKNLIVEGG